MEPPGRFRRRGATDVVLALDDMREMNCVRLGGVVRCDACSFALRDGREIVVNITDPQRIEDALSTSGVLVTGNAAR
jgi:hypothetical protein